MSELNEKGFNPDKVFDPKQIFKKIRDTNIKPKNDKMEQFMSLSLMRDPNSIMASDKLLKQKAYKMNNRGVGNCPFSAKINSKTNRPEKICGGFEYAAGGYYQFG